MQNIAELVVCLEEGPHRPCEGTKMPQPDGAERLHSFLAFMLFIEGFWNVHRELLLNTESSKVTFADL